MSWLRKTTVAGLAMLLLAGAPHRAGAQGRPSTAETPVGDIRVDPSVRPGDDFYAYANNRWAASVARPEGWSVIDTTSALRARNARRIEALVAEVVAHPSSPTTRKIADFQAARLDTAAIEARGMAPIAADLAVIGQISSRRDLAKWLGRLTRLDDGGNVATESLLGVWIHQGFHDPGHYAAHLVQGGLGLSQPADYQDDGRREAYRAHVAAVFRLAGLDRAGQRADRVLALETAIAATHASRADTDDVFKTANTWRRADFDARAPGLDWRAYCDAAGLTAAPSFVVWQPGAVIGAARLAHDQPLEAWRDYLAFHLIEHAAPVLPRAVGEEDRAFEARLSGRAPSPALPPAAMALAATRAVFDDAIGRLYVARYVPAREKAAGEAMARNLRLAFRARLDHTAWMSPSTRIAAQRKLAALRLGIAYPKTWIDYADLAVDPADAFGNQRRAEAFAYRLEVAKLSQPVDPDEWAGGLHPQQANAILNLSPNAMQFAAGLLQPPFFDPEGDIATNYGSAGAGLAHEISHSFDEVGDIYDAQGRLVRWQADGDAARRAAAALPLKAQLDACCPSPDACAHGAQVLGESVADLAGLAVAHDAYARALRGKADVIRDGLTGEQRFFVAFAQRWRKLQTPESAARQIAADTHAPPVCRANLVRNLDAWYVAFDVKPGDRLYLAPPDRAR